MKNYRTLIYYKQFIIQLLAQTLGYIEQIGEHIN